MIADDLLNLIAPLVDSGSPIPSEIETRARWLVLDTLGCAIAGSRSTEVRSWLDRHRLSTDPYGAPVDDAGGGDVVPAMALTMGACWDEACEGHARAHGRPGVAALGAIWPSVTTMTLADLVRAVVVGYEVGARMGAALRIAPGMHVDANWPALGAAAAAATAMRLDPERIVTAVGIAACQLATSLYRPVQTGDTARNTYLGHAALLGRMAAQSSAVGITAPDDTVETYARVAYGRTEVTVEGAGPAEILSGYLKDYAAVRHVHYAARATADLRSAIPADRVESVEVWTYPEAIRYCSIRDPRTPLQAQFSLSFGVAAMLRWGRLDPGVYRSPDFDDATVRAVERSVVIHEEPAWSDRRAARVRLIGRDGQQAESVVTAVRGDAALPWTQDTLERKFLTYCRGTLSAERAESLARHLLRAPLSANVFAPGR